MSTITLTVSDSVAELLRQNPDLLAEAGEAVESLYADADDETVAGVARGLDDFAEGRSLGLEEAFDQARAELERRMMARRSAKSSE